MHFETRSLPCTLSLLPSSLYLLRRFSRRHIDSRFFQSICDRHSENFREQVAAITLPSVRATKFEFEKRFWIICGIYFVGFFLSVFDHTSFIVALRQLIAPSIAQRSVDADRFARAVIAIGALLVFLSAALRTWGAAYLRTEIVHDTAQHSDALVADGPFRYTRNPLYLANLPMARESVFSRAGGDSFFWSWPIGFSFTA
jgi:Phospholipid methyltransferase